MIKLLNGDCLDLMEGLDSNSIDLIIADLPYGITANKWDHVIPMNQLWKQYLRLIKPHGAILLFGLGKFAAKLKLTAPKKCDYRYSWIWEKTMPVGFLHSHQMPLRSYEEILVFYQHLPTYNPQMRQGYKPYTTRRKSQNYGNYENASGNYKPFVSKHGERWPIDRIQFSNNIPKDERVNRTQKPVDLLEYLIKTYTNKGDLVLDNVMGSGSTGVAAKPLQRNFIGIDKDSEQFKQAKARIKEV